MHLLQLINAEREKNGQYPLTKQMMVDMLEWFTLDDWDELITTLKGEDDAR